MALQKSTTLPTGFTADYWKVPHVCVDYVTEDVQVTVLLYKDKAYRTENPDGTIYQKTYSFPLADFNTNVADLRDEAYTQLKALPEFEDATNI